MTEYVVLIQIGDDEENRQYLPILAEDPQHAEEQALDENEDHRVIALFARVL